MTKIKKLAAVVAAAFALQLGGAIVSQAAYAWTPSDNLTKEEKKAAEAKEKALKKQAEKEAAAAKKAQRKAEAKAKDAKEKAENEAQKKRLSAPLGEMKTDAINEHNAQYPFTGHVDVMTLLNGYWYNEHNYPKAVVEDGYVNGYKYVGIEDAVYTTPYDGKGKLVLQDSKGSRHTTSVVWHNDGSKHSYIKLGGETMWVKDGRKDKDYFFESICSVNLGMNDLRVRAVLGNDPDKYFKIDNLGSPDGYSDGWYYSDRDITIGFSPTTGLVDKIELGARGNRRLDVSTLDCTVSPRTYMSRYNMDKEPAVGVAGDNTSIGNGEYIDFEHYPEYISLTIYSR